MSNKNSKSVVTQNTKSTKKGESQMTHKQALQKLMIEHNTYQEYRANNEQSFNFVSTQQLQQWAKTLSKEELDLLTKTYLIQRKFQYKLSRYLVQEKKLNKAYGRETVHSSELDQDILDLMEQKQIKQSEYHNHKHQDDKAIYVANKAIRESEEEEKEVI